MDAKDRKHYRVEIDPEAGVYITLGGGLLKHQVVDLSDGGVCFLLNRDMQQGENFGIELHFPGMDKPLALTTRVIRSIKAESKAAEDGETKSTKEGLDDEDLVEEPKKTTWSIACLFVALTMGQEDRLFREVRKLERSRLTQPKSKYD